MAGDNSALRRRALAALILAESQRGGAGRGTRLPTERQLATDLGVSRAAIRHAMAMLQAEGHVSREVGRGTFLRRTTEVPGPDPSAGRDPTAGQATSVGGVTSASGEPVAGWATSAGGEPAGPTGGQPSGPAGAFGAPDVLSGSDDYAPADVIMVRRLFEPTAMSLVVAWATARDFAEMDRCLLGGERAADHDEFEVWDAALHRSIIEATRSPLLIRLYAEVERARHGRMWGDLKRRSASAARRDEYRRDHEEIVAALKTRDADRATAAMRNHLARVSRHLLGTE
jgi:GntR family transcriptional regulator, uxu operon transcriptional repressor